MGINVKLNYTIIVDVVATIAMHENVGLTRKGPMFYLSIMSGLFKRYYLFTCRCKCTGSNGIYYSETEWESRYEIHDVPDDARFSECEDGWADDEGDEVATVNIPVNQQEESFFIEYARVMGFGVRRHNKRWNTKGMLIGRIWVCSRQGFRQKKFLEKEDRKRKARPITRTGCGVEFRVAIKDDTSRWVCTHFNGNHNHNLTPPHHVHYIRSHRRLSEADIAAASSLNAVGVRPSQIHEYMVERSGGYRDVGYLRKDVQNRLDYEKRRQLQESDAEPCLSYLEGKRSVDPAFYYDFTINEHNRLGDLFWCDGGARADYALFGDVLAFDATYRTNAYRKPFVVLLGINHHRRSIVFGFALLLDETEHTYTWLLQTFLLAMEGKQPKTVITNGDKAMRNAISNKFSDAHHRLCCWHLGRNAQANVNKDFTADFRRCMLRPYTEERFEVKWKEIVQRHNVESHEWVMKMYREKAMWAEAYLRGKFFGGMRSTQRSEGLNAYLNHYVNIKLRLIAFVKQMDRLIDRQWEVEGKDDYDSKEARPVLITHMKPFEAAAAEAYKDECRVHIQGTWDTVSCTCLMMETVGIPCSHLFAVMKVENLEAIPRCMILPRWKKEAKVGVTSEVQERCSQHYMSVEARMGSLHAACRTFQRFAAQSSQAYELAITEIHKVSMQLEAMSCETAKDKPKRHMGRLFEVQDPVIVLTKGCRKKQEMDPPQQRKCRRCGNGGHTVRTCKTHLHRPGDEIDCPTQSSQFMADNTVLLRRRRSAIGKTADECNKINAYDHHYSQPYNNSHAASSNSWYPRFGMSTDNDSTDDTMMQGLIPQYVLPNASTSTFASNYANIWGHNRI
ncbi:protein FAR1-RELATED SEQUENCE [Citrus sinensis]|uniref:Protein FAR1-RELATED SEQUENCE n=1 Tax=Citrus sinensis TaxID=2711 RepID=A0ACB8L9L3_CITSI|nr:protein FAR1-RELATED SEQUENCE [Citrus sinensis]